VASPNPATNNLAITFDNESEDVKSLNKSESVIMSLYNVNDTRLAKQWKFTNNQKQYNLNVSGLRKGQYVIVVDIGKYRSTKQVIIE